MGLVVWALVAGALFGGFIGGHVPINVLIGAVVGAGMGTWLRSAIRLEIADAVAAASQAAEPPREIRPAVPPQAAVAPVTAPRASPLIPALDLTPPEPRRPQPQVRAEPAPERGAPGPVGGYATHQDTVVDIAFAKARDWLLGGNTIVRAGLVMLFLGLVFLARFVANKGLFPIEARLATIAAAGLALLVVGLRLRTKRRDFGLALQGAGVAVLYLVVFAGAKAYEVLPPPAAFAFMIVFAGLGCALAVMQNSLAMAIASFLGGFAVPVLIGGHADTPLGLFAYITILNLAILGIAWPKSWRALNLLGFAGTFALASAWGFTSYTAQQYGLCQAFLIVSVAIYLAMAVLYAHNTPGLLGNFADSTLLFGTALAGFGMQIALVHDHPFASAWSALGFGAAYIGLTALLRRGRAEMRLLNECLLAIGVGFVTLAVPLALGVRWTSSAWALEGAGAFWIGARQARWMPRGFGLVLQALAALVVLAEVLDPLQFNVSAIPLANNGFMQPMLVAATMVYTAWLMRNDLRHSGSRWADIYVQVERGLRAPWFLAGFGMVCLAIVRELGRAAGGGDVYNVVLSTHTQLYLGMIAILGAMALAEWFGTAQDWTVARWPARASLLLVVAGFVVMLVLGRYLMVWPDAAYWVGIVALAAWLLRRLPVSVWTAAMHVGVVILGTGFVADAIWFAIDRGNLWDTSWAGVSFLVSATAMLMAITQWAGRAASRATTEGMGWPLAHYARAYWWHSAAVLAVLVYLGGLVCAVMAQGVTDPLPFVPLVNPVDLAVLLALAALALWRRAVARAHGTSGLARFITGHGGLGALAFLGFVLANMAWLRAAHHLIGMDWNAQALASSQTVEAGLSLLWTVIAMGLMVYSRLRTERIPWLGGASLLAVVVAKLLFSDMANVQGFPRIIAFIGVGVLMLLIGYFVPLPPRDHPTAEVPA